MIDCKSQNTKKDMCITVEKQVWESTLNRSMVLQAENEQLKELLKRCCLAIFDYPPYDLASVKLRLTNKIDEVLK